jgi:hypothetical protein
MLHLGQDLVLAVGRSRLELIAVSLSQAGLAFTLRQELEVNFTISRVRHQATSFLLQGRACLSVAHLHEGGLSLAGSISLALKDACFYSETALILLSTSDTLMLYNLKTMGQLFQAVRVPGSVKLASNGQGQCVLLAQEGNRMRVLPIEVGDLGIRLGEPVPIKVE